MPFNGSGQFVLPAGQPVATGTVIDSTVFNALTSDLATALTNCITRDGQSPATGNIPLGANRITGLAAGVASTDGVNLTQVQALIQNGTLQLLTSVAGTNTITATAIGPIAAYASGQMFVLIPANTTTGAATLNIDSTATPGGIGAKNIFYRGAALVGGELVSGVPALVIYDGTQFNVLVNSFEALPALTMVASIPSVTPVVSGFAGGSTFNSMAGFANAIELVDRASLNNSWKLTPGSATSQTWYLGASVSISHATTFPANSSFQAFITRFNAANVAQSRITIAQAENLSGLSFWAGSGAIVTNIGSATDYFAVETLCSSVTNYNVFSLYWHAWRVA